MSDVRDALTLSSHQDGQISSQTCAASLIGVHKCLRQIIDDAVAVTSFLNTGDENGRLKHHLFSEWITSTGCRLLNLETLENAQRLDPNDRACHVGLATLLSTLYIQNGSRRYLKYHLVGTVLKATIETCYDLAQRNLMLWLLLLGGSTVLAERDLCWVHMRILHMAFELEARNWSDLLSRIKELPWINALHSEPAQRMYEAAGTCKQCSTCST